MNSLVLYVKRAIEKLYNIMEKKGWPVRGMRLYYIIIVQHFTRKAGFSRETLKTLDGPGDKASYTSHYNIKSIVCFVEEEILDNIGLNFHYLTLCTYQATAVCVVSIKEEVCHYVSIYTCILHTRSS